MACDPAEASFFRESVTAAFAAERLAFLRIDFEGKPIAMLVNFLMGRGGFSFKIAFDETMSRFSPGVLIEIDNLRRVLNRDDLDWMASCAAADHARKSVVSGKRVSVRLKLGGSRIF